MKGTVMTVQSLSRRLSSCLFAVIVGSALTVVSAPLPASAACGQEIFPNLNTGGLIIQVFNLNTGKWLNLTGFSVPHPNAPTFPEVWDVALGGTCSDINVRNLNPPPPLVEPRVSSFYFSDLYGRWTWGRKEWVVAFPMGAEIQTITGIANGTTYGVFSRNGAMWARVRT